MIIKQEMINNLGYDMNTNQFKKCEFSNLSIIPNIDVTISKSSLIIAEYRFNIFMVLHAPSAQDSLIIRCCANWIF